MDRTRSLSYMYRLFYDALFLKRVHVRAHAHDIRRFMDKFLNCLFDMSQHKRIGCASLDADIYNAVFSELVPGS